MDTRGNIYTDEPEKIPPEDKARLEGFLKGRAEADLTAHLAERAAMLKEMLSEA